MGDAPADDLAAEIHAETQGNPLFAEEIGRLLAVRGRDRAGPAAHPAGRDRGDRPAPAAPVRRAAASVLALASVVGREFDPDVIGTVARARRGRAVRGARRGGGGRARRGRARGARAVALLAHPRPRRALRGPPRPAAAAPAPRGRRGARGRCTPATPSPIWPSWPTTTARPGPAVADKAIDYAQRGRRPRRGAVRLRGGGRALPRRARAARGRAVGRRRADLRAPARARRGAQPRRRRRRGAQGAAPRGRPGRGRRGGPTSSRARRCRYGGRFGWERASIDPAYVPLLERALAAVGTEDSGARVGLLARLAAAPARRRPRDRRIAAADEAVAIAGRIGDPADPGRRARGPVDRHRGPGRARAGRRHPRVGAADRAGRADRGPRAGVRRPRPPSALLLDARRPQPPSTSSSTPWTPSPTSCASPPSAGTSGPAAPCSR